MGREPDNSTYMYMYKGRLNSSTVYVRGGRRGLCGLVVELGLERTSVHQVSRDLQLTPPVFISQLHCPDYDIILPGSRER